MEATYQGAFPFIEARRLGKTSEFINVFIIYDVNMCRG